MKDKMEVNKDNMRLWVADLRSGVYPQGVMALCYRIGNSGWKHCCLGVACKTAINSGLEVEVRESIGNKSFDNDETELPESVMDWLGIDQQNPVVGLDAFGAEVTAMEANDKFNWDFNQIADAIEKYYEL